jgi:predicted nucleic acid-binding protein
MDPRRRGRNEKVSGIVVTLFLDTSVLLAACESATGASRFVIESAAAQNWTLRISSYVLDELEANLPRVSKEAFNYAVNAKTRLTMVRDVLNFPWISIFVPTKDRPILFTAAACAEILLTLDRRHFQQAIGRAFYDLEIMEPADFLIRERLAGRLR